MGWKHPIIKAQPMKITKVLSTVLLTFLFSFTSYRSDKPKILIIGDSISIGYTPFVKEHFQGKATVVHNPGNAQHTGTGLAKVEEWIGTEDWDIIQMNWGLWDLCYRHPDSKLYGKRDKVNGTVFASVEEYEQNLEAIIMKVKAKSDAKLIFVTTSYVPKEEGGRFTKDPQRYNKAAKRVMKKHRIIVNDIYKSSKSIHKLHGKGNDDVHYTKEGSKKLAMIISDFLEKEL